MRDRDSLEYWFELITACGLIIGNIWGFILLFSDYSRLEKFFVLCAVIGLNMLTLIHDRIPHKPKSKY